MLLKNMEYNPKIDYLLCKSLLKMYPENVDENHLKDCFFNKEACQTEEELSLCMIRNFFLQHNLLTIKKEEVQAFFKYINIDYTFKGFTGKSVEEKIHSLIKSIENKLIEEQELILKFLVVVVYAKERNELIIPYGKGIKRLLLVSSLEETKSILSYLENKTNRLRVKHDVRLNSLILAFLDKLVPLFLEITGYLGVGVYGSFSLETTNEYSDLDLMVITAEGEDRYEVRSNTRQFFCQFIPIPIDVKVTTLRTIESDLTMGMKKTLKILGGNVRWKKSMN